MKIPISKSQKTQLQEVIKTGIFDSDIFPELEKALNKDEMKEITDRGYIDTRDEFFKNMKY